jgi:UDP-N-acetylmuramoyl-L-alanyl-D-glutamate--2,6-diaminopimelate ligase
MMPATHTGFSVTLGDLLGESVPAALRSRPVGDLTLDSRRVTPGALFLALPGRRSHGLRFASEALRAGAVAVAWEAVPGEDTTIAIPVAAQFAVPGLRARLGVLADRFFGRPSERLAVTGVTGTNGKTTVSHLVAGALERLGRPAAVIGTLGSGRPGARTC